MRKLAFPALLAIAVLAIPFAASGQSPTPTPAPAPAPPTTLRGILLEQLRTTHDREDWFVPANVAVAGLTAEQAKWSPGKGNHSIGQLAYHIWYWDDRALAKFNGEKPARSTETTTSPLTISPRRNGMTW